MTVTEGRVMGKVKAPITAYVRKAGVDYSAVTEPSAAGGADARKRGGGTRTSTGTPVPVSPSNGDEATDPAAIGGSAEPPPPASDQPIPDESTSTIGP